MRLSVNAASESGGGGIRGRWARREGLVNEIKDERQVRKAVTRPGER